MEHIQSLTDDLMALHIQDIRDANAIFCKLIPLISFKKYIATKLLENPMPRILQSLQSSRYLDFTSRCCISNNLYISSSIYKNHYQTTPMANFYILYARCGNVNKAKCSFIDAISNVQTNTKQEEYQPLLPLTPVKYVVKGYSENRNIMDVITTTHRNNSSSDTS